MHIITFNKMEFLTLEEKNTFYVISKIRLMKSNYSAGDFDKKGSNNFTRTLVMPHIALEPKDYISVHISNVSLPGSCSKSHKAGNDRNLGDSVLVSSEHKLSHYP